MRRVDRGPRPVDGGEPKRFRPFQRAKRDLLERLGPYCSYCERADDALHVEHVVSRLRRPDLEGEWTNFLLGCPNCNGIKGARNESRQGYTWPDDDAVWGPFEYLPEGLVRVAGGLAVEEQAQAERLFELVGLGRRPRRAPQASDLRHLRRQAAWRTARMALGKFAEGRADLDLLVALAQGTGFWSVWMTVFADQPEACERFRAAFPGTRWQAATTLL